jgi:nucleoid-associated protein YgaU
MRAYVEGIHYAKTHRKETLDILAKYLRSDDREVLEETYENIMLTLVPEKPYPTLKGIQIMLREMGVKDAAARTAKPEQFVDLSFVKELDGSGFIDRLYKSPAVAKAAPARAEKAAPPAPASTKAAPAEDKTKLAARTERPEPTQAVAKPVRAPTAQAERGTSYVVEAGDNLSRIALRFYNSNYKWNKIFEANRDTLKNPHYIYIGQNLIIPPDDGR